MYGSKNSFFKQRKSELVICKKKVSTILQLKERDKVVVKEYLTAFDFFCKNPSEYDGATIVKDLVDIRKNKYYLDIDAMLHDYEYVVGKADTIKDRFICDYKYIRNMELNGKGIRVPRMIILTTYGLITISYKKIRRWLKRK